MYPAQGECVFDVENKDREVLQQAEMMEAGAFEVPEITEATYYSDV